jgi:hypothetical protein
MSHGENHHKILRFPILVQRDVPRSAARDHEFPEPVLGKTPDQWMALEDGEGIEDQALGLRGGCGIGRESEIYQPLEVCLGARIER